MTLFRRRPGNAIAVHRHSEEADMRAFWLSVAAAVVIGVAAWGVLNAIGYDSATVYSTPGTTRL